MKLYFKYDYAFFFDRNIRFWTLYPVDKEHNRIEHDSLGNPIEALYFNNKNQLFLFLNRKKNI